MKNIQDSGLWQPGPNQSLIERFRARGDTHDLRFFKLDEIGFHRGIDISFSHLIFSPTHECDEWTI